MVEISGLKKSYRNHVVLDGLNMTLGDGDVYGFLGRNGCGKTTTMNILCDIVEKDAGRISFRGGQKVKIGYLPETPSIFGYMNSYEYLDYIASCLNMKAEADIRTKEVLRIVGLENDGQRRVKGYSRGMNQRLGIAAALYGRPELLILDEPTSALDPEGRAEVMEIIKKLTEMGVTILLCTHILSDVERVANKIGILAGGRMRVEGAINEIVDRYTSGRVSIALDLYNPTPESVSIVANSGAANEVYVNERTGTMTFVTGDPERVCAKLTKTMADNSLSPRDMQVMRTTLEQIYLKVVNENA